ncbi:UDP-N-acetylglucosamine diphosphorylase/glucosamine-1-phosphate N-acetyltransferase [Moraxella caviae]|uniref:Bifunctional protein GlmU n=1 Tax=Moraxella caviae TaxID=34060 RepID=A0A1T0A1F8_9GAMM|nr:bifunctional UDP-N-acetylglucosamine diphosphorylase/glucosamine-1-phosphate N-acetyltransferase GlmU [Moraxella caviae]OOR89616.1 UDP-N-acetylglucosamine diphosphorylase/glucosamine-1-phosphate N-acetyltransferase [Moraxella caviae]STZ10303.1 Bifunctional protein GlmU [Moraxella caviae]
MSVSIIILAGGKGTRMKSIKPKVLQTLAGKPLLRHVLDTCKPLNAKHTILIYGYNGQMVKDEIRDDGIVWAEQAEQLGTGHAVQMALPHLPKDGKSLILYGDVPLTQLDTLQKLIDSNMDGISMLTLEVDNPFGLGRIIRDDGKVVAIVEEKDANDSQKQVKEINSGIYCVDNALLHDYLPKLNNDNAQGEYYLTDIIKMAVADNVDISTISPTLAFEIEGVNDRIQLANLERTYQAHQVHALQIAGVQFADPSRVDIRGTLSCGSDVFIDINTVFTGDVRLENGVRIDAGNIITDCTIGENSHIKPNCVLSESQIGQGVAIGPFAHIRPKSDIGDDVKIGNFVETKKSTLHAGAKVSHLSYIGDAIVGREVNVGAGVITCNYDGVNKFTTEIGDGAFIGSNSSLVAPVKIGENATIGAGSVITKDAPDGKLAVARSRQTVIDGWQRPSKK